MRCFPAWTALVLLLLPGWMSSEQLEFGVQRGARIEKTFSSRGELELVELLVSLNGEDLEDLSADSGMSTSWNVELVFLDEYREVGPDRPLVLAREHRSLGSRQRFDVDGEGSEEEALESALEGETVLFTWNADDGEYARSFEDDGDPDPSLLEGLEADTDLLGFLPGEAVAEGDSWKLDIALYLQLSDPGGELHLESEDDYDDEDDDSTEQLRENLEGELQATFRGWRDEDDVRVAVIALRTENSTHATEHAEDEDGDPVETVLRVEVEAQGELLWDPARGRPHSFEVAGDTRLIHTATTTWDDEDTGERMVLVERLEMAGEFMVSGTWRARD